MCFTCTLEEVTGREGGFSPEDVREIEWPECTPEMILLARLRWALYECTSAGTGGPMHVFTDDYNVDDHNVEFCRKEAQIGSTSWFTDREDWPLVSAISLRMCELAMPMTTVQRTVALSLSWGELRLDHEGKITAEMVPLWQRRRREQLQPS